MLRTILVVLCTLSFAHATVTEEVVREDRAMQIKDILRQGLVAADYSSFTPKEVMDAAWDLIFEDGVKLDISKISKDAEFDLAEMIRTHAVEAWYGDRLTNFPQVLSDLNSALESGMISRRALYLLLNHREDLFAHYGPEIYDQLNDVARFDLHDYNQAQNITSMSQDQARAMFWNAPDASNFLNGQYADGIRLFMFCRHNRNYPCLMVMKDKWGMPVRENGEVWTQPAMAASSRGIPYNITNGNTPAGVHLINGVMPYADQQLSFGKFRRIIMNFVPMSSNDEHLTRSLLNEAVHDLPFWRQANVARDVGRDLLRIHGTGRINDDPTSAHYPFRKTSGCVSKREGSYPEGDYQDQRLMLDTMMQSLGLEAAYNNETKIKGIFTIAELDNQAAPVSREEVLNLLFD